MTAIQEIDVVLNLDDISLKVEDSRRQIKTGQQVVWRFKAEKKTDSESVEVPFPAGWVPLVLFEAEGPRVGQPHLNYGPFDGLTQVLGAANGAEVLSVESLGVAVKSGVFRYYAGLSRGAVEGQEAGDHRECRLLSTARRELEVTGEPVGNVAIPVEPDLEFAVYRETDRLRIEEVKVPKKNAAGDPITQVGNTVVWQFSDLEKEAGLYPSVLFYNYAGTAGSDVNVSFGPFNSLTCEPGKATGHVNSIRGVYSYEAVVLKSRFLEIELTSSGDPQIDNEGDPDVRE